ncbi:hypothetical protein MBCUT_11880 [Methanobrevibacter cuticularis]|uniref:DUF4411 domain-containing protein n=1 Tax=Methanobrevibacter cuticularis TaxID=47311 RepID=A0A166DSQ4_9EURY|nr:DUF4411 family protein [Methanobrevibacter cuticularis]KZX15913.1 hypothetical protein MBCUT_11880 [Methanobrevibacter cuticularis]
MCFIIDTDSLINLKRNYPTNVFISLWDNIKDMKLNKELISLKEVQAELSTEDRIFWTTFHDMTGNFFIEATNEEMDNLKELECFKVYDTLWCDGESLADPILICVGLHNDYTVITQENQRSEMRIPFVCNELGVNCLSTNQFFENQNWKF